MRRLRIWPSPSLQAAVEPLAGPPPFPLDRPGARLYAQARGALRDCVPAVGLEPGDEILVPSYHHGSEVEALLGAGLHCRPYEPAADLQPDEEQLEALVTPSTRALHLIHYLGFPQDSARWRTWCDRHGLLLVEDAAQAWLAVRDGQPVGSLGDLSVFCLYKTIGLPDGAAAHGRVELPQPARHGALGTSYLVRPAARRASELIGWRPRTTVYDQHADIAVPPRSRAASLLTRRLLDRNDVALAAERRRANYRVLLDALHPLVPAPFDALPVGASPFVFPIAVRDKALARGVLEGQGIQASDMWRLPHPAFPVAGRHASWRRHLLGLPVHQDLDPTDLARLVRVARRLERARGDELNGSGGISAATSGLC